MLWWGKKQQNTKPKKWHLLFFLAIILCWGGLKLYDYFYWPEAVIKIGSSPEIKVLVADSPNHYYRGWSGRENMGDYQGMLFLYNRRQQHNMVMRDMEFSLDIIWLDGDTILDMAQNIQPEEGKEETELTVYRARGPSTAVLELPAGFIEEHGLIIGDKAQMVK